MELGASAAIDVQKQDIEEHVMRVTEGRGADVVLFQPESDDSEIFFTSLFSYATRSRVCEHAFAERYAGQRFVTVVPDEAPPAVLPPGALNGTWDLVEKDSNTIYDYTAHLRQELNFMPYVPFAFISAKFGQREFQSLTVEIFVAAHGHFFRNP